MKQFINLGTRNKGTFWEYVSAFSFAHTVLPITSYSIPSFLGFGQGEQNQHCHHVDVIERTKRLLIAEFKEGKYTKEFFEQLDAVYRKPLEEIKKIAAQDFLHDDNAALIKKIDLITKALAESHKPMLLALKSQFISEYFREELLQALHTEEREDGGKILTITSLLLTPTRLTLAQQEEELLFQILSIFTQEGYQRNAEDFAGFCERPDIKPLLQNLAAKCGWFHMEYMQEPWTIADYREHLWGKISKAPENATVPSQKIAEIQTQQDRFFTDHPDSEVLKNLAFALREFSFILDASKAMIIEGSFTARPLFTHIAGLLGLTWKDMLYLTLPEIVALLQNNQRADKQLVEERKQCRAVLLQDGKITYYHGEEAARLGNSLIEQASTEGEAPVKGIVGYPGKVRGRVTVIRSILDRHKFTAGDILVTHDGTAELTLFLKQAAAIVTDQGGMISHAAIIAREMKTPCVLGTKVATQAFRDGDFVEVDAEKGTVRKLSAPQ